MVGFSNNEGENIFQDPKMTTIWGWEMLNIKKLEY